MRRRVGAPAKLRVAPNRLCAVVAELPEGALVDRLAEVTHGAVCWSRVRHEGREGWGADLVLQPHGAATSPTPASPSVTREMLDAAMSQAVGGLEERMDALATRSHEEREAAQEAADALVGEREAHALNAEAWSRERGELEGLHSEVAAERRARLDAERRAVEAERQAAERESQAREDAAHKTLAAERQALADELRKAQVSASRTAAAEVEAERQVLAAERRTFEVAVAVASAAGMVPMAAAQPSPPKALAHAVPVSSPQREPEPDPDPAEPQPEPEPEPFSDAGQLPATPPRRPPLHDAQQLPHHTLSPGAAAAARLLEEADMADAVADEMEELAREMAAQLQAASAEPD